MYKRAFKLTSLKIKWELRERKLWKGGGVCVLFPPNVLQPEEKLGVQTVLAISSLPYVEFVSIRFRRV